MLLNSATNDISTTEIRWLFTVDENVSEEGALSAGRWITKRCCDVLRLIPFLFVVRISYNNITFKLNNSVKFNMKWAHNLFIPVCLAPKEYDRESLFSLISTRISVNSTCGFWALKSSILWNVVWIILLPLLKAAEKINKITKIAAFISTSIHFDWQT